MSAISLLSLFAPSFSHLSRELSKGRIQAASDVLFQLRTDSKRTVDNARAQDRWASRGMGISEGGVESGAATPDVAEWRHCEVEEELEAIARGVSASIHDFDQILCQPSQRGQCKEAGTPQMQRFL